MLISTTAFYNAVYRHIWYQNLQNLMQISIEWMHEFKKFISDMKPVELLSAIENLMEILWLITNLFDVCWIKKVQLQIATRNRPPGLRTSSVRTEHEAHKRH